MALIPPRGAKSRSEIDHHVARQPLFSKGLCFPEYLLSVRQRTMRLLVAERPEWRKVGKTRQPHVFSEEAGRICDDDKHVQGKRSLRIRRHKSAVAARQVEGPKGMVNKQRPALGADEPWNRKPRTQHPELGL